MKRHLTFAALGMFATVGLYAAIFFVVGLLTFIEHAYGSLAAVMVLFIPVGALIGVVLSEEEL